MQLSFEYPFSSRAACYGDGCFTTISVENGQAELLSAHITRLQKACQKLAIVVAQSDWQKLQLTIQIKAQELQQGIVKIIISAGNGGRGYSRNSESEAYCYFQTLPPVTHYKQWQKTGISLNVSEHKLSCNPELAGIKHLNRLEQVLIKQQALVKQQTPPCEDSIVLDDQDMMVEVSAGNLFWCSYGRWFTPDLTLCGVEGVMRNRVVSILNAKKQRVDQVRAKLTALNLATDIFICNSLMKIIPVNRICINDKKELIINNSTTAKILVMLEEKMLQETML